MTDQNGKRHPPGSNLPAALTTFMGVLTLKSKSRPPFWRSWLMAILLFTGTARAADLPSGPTGWIEPLEAAHIDWTAALVIATGTLPCDTSTNGVNPLDAARQQARSRLATALMAVQVDARRRIGDLAEADSPLAALLAELTAAAQVIDETCPPQGPASATVALPMTGALSQIVLPEDLREVQPVQPVGAPVASATPEDRRTGLLVDARGTDLHPAMVLTIRDENGVEVFGPAFVSREFAVQSGMCGYLTDLEAARREARIGENPLLIKALRSAGPSRTELIVTRSDAAALHGVSAHLAFLRTCQVVVVLDPPPVKK